MAIETSVYRFISSNEAVIDLVGSHVYKYHVPQSFDWSGPAISLWRVSEQHEPDLDGVVQIADARIQIDVWSTDPAVAESVTESMRLILQGYSGPLDEQTEAVEIILDNIASLPEQPEDGSDDWTHHVASDYLISYRQPIE